MGDVERLIGQELKMDNKEACNHTLGYMIIDYLCTKYGIAEQREPAIRL